MLPAFRAISGVEPDDDAAFDRHAVKLAAQYTILASALMTVITLIWWPVDYWVRPDARYVEVFALLRARALIVFVAALAAFLGSSAVRRAALVVAPAFYAALIACIGYSLGRLGGVDLAWFADATVALVPPALLPLRPARRVVTLLFISLLLPAAYFLPFPENLRAPSARGQLSFVLFVYVFAVLIGELLYRLLRRMFLQQRSLDRARAELAALNTSLEGRVAAQTRDLQALTEHLEQAQEAERHRVSNDLHDELGQRLTAMRYTLTLLEDRARWQPATVPALAAELTQMLEDTTAAVRDVIAHLKPRVLDDLGLTAAAEWLNERVLAVGDVDCRLAVSREVPAAEACLDPEDALLLFRMLQEATTNARKHSGATRLEISLDAGDGALTAAVRDDGVGFDPSAPSGGFGLLGLSERARRRGGRLVVISAPGRGTTISLAAPARHRQPGSARAEGGAEGRP